MQSGMRAKQKQQKNKRTTTAIVIIVLFVSTRVRTVIPQIEHGILIE